MISAHCQEARVEISNIKYLRKNKIFLISFQRYLKEEKDSNIKINSILKLDFIDSVKSKNINQNEKNINLELLAIDLLKNKENYEINLIFSDNAYIVLSTEIIEATLEDQN